MHSHLSLGTEWGGLLAQVRLRLDCYLLPRLEVRRQVQLPERPHPKRLNFPNLGPRARPDRPLLRWLRQRTSRQPINPVSDPDSLAIAPQLRTFTPDQGGERTGLTPWMVQPPPESTSCEGTMV